MVKIKGKTYQDRTVKQALLWLNGRSVHNTIDDECCPDFSCCSGKPIKRSLYQKKRIVEQILCDCSRNH